MKLTGKLMEAINDQVTLEMEAAVVYRQLAIEMEVIDLPGIAGWFRAQSDEEIVQFILTIVSDLSPVPLQ